MGFPALHEFTKGINNLQKMRAQSKADLPEVGTYLVRFKLHLASKDSGESSAAKLPKGSTVTNVVADFLREIGASIMRHLRSKYKDDLTMESVQWCVTVPSIWDDLAKKQMETSRRSRWRSAWRVQGSPGVRSLQAGSLTFVLYSSGEPNPKYTRGHGVDSKEGARFEVDITAGAHVEERPIVKAINVLRALCYSGKGSGPELWQW